MARVTIELRNLMKMTNFELFDFDYGIADQAWKVQFENAFVDYYWYHEIGSETPDRWKHRLKARLQKIMPYYNELYMTTLHDIDPLLTNHIEETMKDNTIITNKSNSNINEAADDLTEQTDYPQTSGIDSDIPSSRARIKGNRNSGSDVKSEGSTARDYSKIIKGFVGDQGQLLKSYRENILNVTSLLIDELKDMFILVY